MKLSTARRIIKESKKGKAHPPELVARCHEVCHEYHDKVSAEKAAVASFVAEATKGLNEAEAKVVGAQAKEHAEKKLKEMRQAAYAPRPVMAYEATGMNDRDEKGNLRPAKHDPMHSTLLHSEKKQAVDARAK